MKVRAGRGVDRFVVFVFPPHLKCFANNTLIDVEKKEDVSLPFLFQLCDISKQEKAHIDSF